MAQRTFALLNPVQFTPHGATVYVPVQQVTVNGTPTPSVPLDHVDLTRDELLTTDAAKAAITAIEEGVRQMTQQELAARFVGDTIEILMIDEWEQRQQPAQAPAPASTTAPAAAPAPSPTL